MKNKKTLCFVLFSAILVLNVNSCMGQEDGPLGEEIEFQIIDEGYSSGYGEESYLVIRDVMEWTDVWERHSRTLMLTPCPEIDFSKNMVICAFMGEFYTTGYSISIEKIHLQDDTMYVMIVKHQPPPGAVVGQAITYPYIIVCLERLDLEVVFDVDGDAQVTIPPPNVVVSIVSPSDSQTGMQYQMVIVSTNGYSVGLFLNGVSEGYQTSGFRWSTTLSAGENNITAVAVDNAGDTAVDTHMITLDSGVTDTDYDNDGMPNGWETNNSLNPLNAVDAPLDPDNDGLTNLQEYYRGTDPNVSNVKEVFPPANWWIAGIVGVVAAFILACIYLRGKNIAVRDESFE